MYSTYADILRMNKSSTAASIIYFAYNNYFAEKYISDADRRKIFNL